MRIPPWLVLIGAVGLFLALTTGGVVTADILSTAWMASTNARKWAATLQSTEDYYGIPAGLLARIAYQESHFIQSIIDGTRPSPAGALGVMQLMPQYFSSVQRPVPFSDADTTDQINQAADFLVSLYHHFQDWTPAVAAYNAGQTAIDQVLAGSRALPSETAQYIAQVSADLPQVVSPTLSV